MNTVLFAKLMLLMVIMAGAIVLLVDLIFGGPLQESAMMIGRVMLIAVAAFLVLEFWPKDEPRE